jgi:hypothetical protein
LHAYSIPQLHADTVPLVNDAHAYTDWKRL